MLFSGLIEVAKDANIINVLTKYINKPLKLLFENIEEDILNDISLNLTCNFLGMSNASITSGLNALNKLKEQGYNNEIITFITLNASGFCLIPQSVLSIRSTYISNSFDIILPTFLLSLTSFILTIIFNKILVRYD